MALSAVLVASLCACEQRVASAEQPAPLSSGRTSTTLAALQESPSSASAMREGAVPEDTTAEEMEAASLRRGYGVVDMRSNGCVSQRNDHTFRAEGCPAGFVIYGPYVPVPANSEIEVSFEVKASSRIEIYADIVSQMGAKSLAGLNRQVIEPGASHKLGYRVHVFGADANVESRIGVSAGSSVPFEISHFTMVVR